MSGIWNVFLLSWLMLPVWAEASRLCCGIRLGFLVVFLNHRYGFNVSFQKNWSMCLHHVCGDHGRFHPNGGTSLLSECLHKELSAEQLAEDANRQLKEGGPAHAALRNVVFSDKTMRRADGVLRFRHTSSLESYHSTTLAYTPKRVFYE